MDTPTPNDAARDAGAASEFNAAFPPQYTVLGVKLLPLSLGRYRIMKWAGVSFVADEETVPTVEDLFTGIVIAGMKCDEFLQLLSNGKLQKTLRKFGKILRKRMDREKDFNIHQKIELFSKYILDAQTLPWIPLPIQNDSAMNPTRTHWSTTAEVVLRGALNWSKQEIDEEPLSKALADYFKHMENEGSVVLMPHELYQEMNDEGMKNAEVLERMAAAREEAENKEGATVWD